MHIRALGLVLGLISMSSAANDLDDWALLASSADEETFYYGLKGSWVAKQNKAGERVYVIKGKAVEQKTKASDLYLWYVAEKDCAKNQGDLTFATTSGEYLQDVDFTKEKDTVSWRIANTICGFARLKRDKSL